MHKLGFIALIACLACESSSPETPSPDPDTEVVLGEDTTVPEVSDGPIEPAVVRSLSFTESDARVRNPERGFYSYITLTEDRDLSWVEQRGHRLVFSYVRLDAYRDTAISAELLEAMATGLDSVREAGMKVILRFAYNAGPYPDSEPDASKAQVLAHIAQLEPTLRAHTDVIAVVQAGFVGAWGEWHSSTNGLLDDPADRRDILEALLDAVPAEHQVQLRYPPYKGEMYGDPLSEATAFTDTYAARTGHHNDCFLASDTDLGTYPSNAIETWKAYVAEDTRFVVMGGETCADNPPRSSCDTTVEEMERLHFTYINHDYHPDVVEGWRSEGCFESLERRLGYRLVARSATLPEAILPGGRFAFELTLENVGFAAPIHARPVNLVINGPERHVLSLSDVDVRQWYPGAPITLSSMLELPASLPEGTYSLALELPDPSARLAPRPEYAIQLANEALWNAGLNRLGAFEVSANASGGSNVNAEVFREL